MQTNTTIYEFQYEQSTLTNHHVIKGLAENGQVFGGTLDVLYLNKRIDP
jgi:hypothetical protein